VGALACYLRRYEASFCRQATYALVFERAVEGCGNQTKGDTMMKNQQLNQLLYEALETEMGGNTSLRERNPMRYKP
jgi:hypothetical protein